MADNWDDELNRVISEVKSLSGLPTLTARRAASKIIGVIDEQFDEGKDPYGNEWEDLAQSTLDKGRTPPPLTDTGDMKDSVVIAAEGTTITASADDPFPYHQAGTGNMPARPVLPDERGVPESWEEAIDEAVTEELQFYELFKNG